MDPVFSVIKQEMKQALLRQRSRLIPKHPIWVPFRYMARKTGIKLKPGPFYRLLVLFHLILLPPPPNGVYCCQSWLCLGVLFQENVALHRRNRGSASTIHHPPSSVLPASEWQSSERITSSVGGLNVLTQSCQACFHRVWLWDIFPGRLPKACCCVVAFAAAAFLWKNMLSISTKRKKKRAVKSVQTINISAEKRCNVLLQLSGHIKIW